MKYCLMSWRTLWHHNVPLVVLFDTFLTDELFTSWCIFHFMTNFFTSWRIFWRQDVFRRYDALFDWRTFWRQDVFLTSLRTFWRYDVFWRHDVFNVMINLLASWRVFDVIMHLLTSWRTFWRYLRTLRTFWRHDVCLRHDKLLDTVMYYPYILTLWRTLR